MNDERRRFVRRTDYTDGTEQVIEVVYRKPTLDQYPPHYSHRVVITEGTRHGRAKRHTFVRRFSKESGPSRWRLEPAISIKSTLHEQRQSEQSGEPIRGRAEPPLKAGTNVTLCGGFKLPATMLVAILDACTSEALHQIDIADIKTIVSQLGSRISQIESLTPEQRRLAEPALYTEILRRCTTIESVSTTDLESGENG